MRTTSATRLTLTLLALAATCLPAAAGSRPDVPIPERIRGAERTVVARVIGVKPAWVQNRWGDRLIVSQVALAVEETLKGRAARALQMTVDGGTLDGLTLHVSGIPMLEPGDRGVFLLNEHAAGQHVPHQRGLGILKLTGDDQVEGAELTLDAIRAMARDVR